MPRVILFAIALLLPAAATAEELFDNFEGSYSPTRGNYLVGPESLNPPILPPVQWAMSFEVAVDAGSGPWRLTAIEMPVQWQTYGSDSLEVHLHLDGGGVPGTRVASATIPDVPFSPVIVREATFSGGVGLVQGVTYWVVVNSVEGGEHTWQEVEPRTDGGQMLYWLFNDGGPWTQSAAPASAFRVNGVVDPSVGDSRASVGAMKSRFR